MYSESCLLCVVIGNGYWSEYLCEKSNFLYFCCMSVNVKVISENNDVYPRNYFICDIHLI